MCLCVNQGGTNHNRYMYCVLRTADGQEVSTISLVIILAVVIVGVITSVNIVVIVVVLRRRRSCSSRFYASLLNTQRDFLFNKICYYEV